MKNNQEKAAMTAAEKLGEALVLKPEWEVKPKSVVMTHVFSVTFNESTKELQLEVNGDVYQTLRCKRYPKWKNKISRRFKSRS